MPGIKSVNFIPIYLKNSTLTVSLIKVETKLSSSSGFRQITISLPAKALNKLAKLEDTIAISKSETMNH